MPLNYWNNVEDIMSITTDQQDVVSIILIITNQINNDSMTFFSLSKSRRSVAVISTLFDYEPKVEKMKQCQNSKSIQWHVGWFNIIPTIVCYLWGTVL